MKILFLTNNKITMPLIEWLKDNAEEVTVYSEQFDPQYIKSLSPEIVISYNYKYIIKEDIIGLMKGRIINLHISLLPWNRGADPNLWSFIEDSPKGVTIHYVDKGIDTGNILLQETADFNENIETLRSSYKILHKKIQLLFINNWDKIKNLQIIPRAQSGHGSFHYSNELVKIKEALGEQIWSLPIRELKQKLADMHLR